MKLLALRCPHCEQPLTPGNDHIITLCPDCSKAIGIGDEGLTPLDIYYAAPQDRSGVSQWQPFWIFEGQVHLLERKTQGGGKSGGKAAEKLWGQPRRFYVPAWEMSMQTAQDIGSRLLQQQPVYAPGPQPVQPRLLPVVVTAEDAAKLLEFIVLAIEARRDDWLKDLEFRLEISEPQLWALPVGANDVGLSR